MIYRLRSHSRAPRRKGGIIASGARGIRDDHDGFMLDSIQLEVKRGQVVALVGSSGAGKTTLANLVPRFQDITSGAVLIDGLDIRDLDLHSLRDKFPWWRRIRSLQ